ncbi:hypothetical protein K439DRAFT_1619757 [Ramaria rubella]|nr:hypothetical protein K439DRAFT_1619757 [Ramaria rubella]
MPNKRTNAKWVRKSVTNKRVVVDLSLDGNKCPEQETIAGLYSIKAIDDAELWNEARSDIVALILAECPRFYRAAPPMVVPHGSNLFDRWYVMTFAIVAGGKITFQENQIAYPKIYTPHLQRLNCHIRALLLTLAGDPQWEATIPEPSVVCLTGYLLALRECFTTEAYEACLSGNMTTTWRSRWLHDYLHRERQGNDESSGKRLTKTFGMPDADVWHYLGITQRTRADNDGYTSTHVVVKLPKTKSGDPRVAQAIKKIEKRAVEVVCMKGKRGIADDNSSPVEGGSDSEMMVDKSPDLDLSVNNAYNGGMEFEDGNSNTGTQVRRPDDIDVPTTNLLAETLPAVSENHRDELSSHQTSAPFPLPGVPEGPAPLPHPSEPYQGSTAPLSPVKTWLNPSSGTGNDHQQAPHAQSPPVGATDQNMGLPPDDAQVTKSNLADDSRIALAPEDRPTGFSTQIPDSKQHSASSSQSSPAESEFEGDGKGTTAPITRSSTPQSSPVPTPPETEQSASTSMQRKRAHEGETLLYM